MIMDAAVRQLWWTLRPDFTKNVYVDNLTSLTTVVANTLVCKRNTKCMKAVILIRLMTVQIYVAFIYNYYGNNQTEPFVTW